MSVKRPVGGLSYRSQLSRGLAGASRMGAKRLIQSTRAASGHLEPGAGGSDVYRRDGTGLVDPRQRCRRMPTFAALSGFAGA